MHINNLLYGFTAVADCQAVAVAAATCGQFVRMSLIFGVSVILRDWGFLDFYYIG